MLQHELIGLQVEVVKSLNRTQVHTAGRVSDESMKTLTIENGVKRRMIPKQGTLFRFTLATGEQVELNGDLILRRPEDRVKMTKARRI